MKRFLIVGALLGFCWTVAAQKYPFSNVSIEEFDKLRKQPDVMVLDMRLAQEFAAGHIPGATNLYHAELNKINGLDKSKTWLVHCRAGAHSGKVMDQMALMKFKKVYNLPGGFQAWEKAGKPIEK